MTSTRDSGITLPVAEEQLEVGRKVVDIGMLRLRKRVDEVPTHVREPVALETVDVRRVPIGRVVDEPPPMRQEGDVTVVPVLHERVVTRKELVLVEEVHLIRRREVVHAEAQVLLRRERVEVERLDPGNEQAEPTGRVRPDLNSQEQVTMQSVFAAFDDPAQAQRAVEQLVQRGFDRADVHIQEREEQASPSAGANQSEVKNQGGIAGFFAGLFDTDDDYTRQGSVWQEAARRGSCVVVVDVPDERSAEQAVTCLHDAGAVDVDERKEQWRKEGWTGGYPQRGTSAGVGTPEGVAEVVQEELKVGKRTLDKGGVRVIQRLSEKPVREIVRLREEQAVVERQPVDRPVEASNLDTFKEGAVEVRESAEEPVVAKSARVVEEVRVGKQVQEREEVIEDTLRRKDVDVERVAGDAMRERAIASDQEKPVSKERDPEVGGTLGTRRADKDR
jgi:stress response protein YsnF